MTRVLLALGAVALLVAHVVLLRQMSSRIALPMEIALAVITVIVLAHLGVFRTLLARFRRHD